MKLSEDAWAESVPNLEIENNDVRCSHASAVGPIDGDQLFFLESRGVPTAVAERLIILGFYQDVLSQAPDRAMARLVEGRLADRLDFELVDAAPEPVTARRWTRRTRRAHVACRRDEMEVGTARRIDVGGHRIALVRLPDGYRAVGDRCSHADYPLSEGDVWEEDCMIECPKHGSRFSLVDGEPETLPATRPVAVYEVTVDGDDVLVEVPAGDGGGDHE